MSYDRMQDLEDANRIHLETIATLQMQLAQAAPLANRWKHVEKNFIAELRDAIQKEGVNDICESGIQRFCDRIGVEYIPITQQWRFDFSFLASVPEGEIYDLKQYLREAFEQVLTDVKENHDNTTFVDDIHIEVREE